MRKDWKYILFISLIFGAYIYIQLNSKKDRSWYLSLDYTDKEPYGAVVLHKILPQIFPDGVKVNGKTLYELQDSLKADDNLFILAREFNPTKEDIGALIEVVNKGHDVFISAESFGQTLRDTLHVESFYNFWTYSTFNESDSLKVVFNNESLKPEGEFYFKTINLQNYFSNYAADSTSVIAHDSRDYKLTLKISWGTGNIFLNSTPAAFTNIYALRGNEKFISASLSVLAPTRLIWLENYQIGNRELATPLRFILTNEPLSWAYYLTIFALLFFIVFEIKRKQRPIPVIPPLANTSLEFVGTIGNLYYQRGDHKNIIEKRIHFFFDYVRTHYYLHGNEQDFAQRLSKKSMKPLEQIQTLMQNIQNCLQARAMTVEEMSSLNKNIEEFYHKT